MTKISLQYTSESFGPNPNLDQKILIFEDRELGWRFQIARKIEKIPDAGYALIAVLFAYFEMVAQYSSGISSDGHSREFFRNGVRLVYQTPQWNDPQLDTIYSNVRCGMYHNGYTKFGTLIAGGFCDALAINGNTVLVNPHRLRADLQAHFESYVAMLKDVKKITERAKFETIFDAGTS